MQTNGEITRLLQESSAGDEISLEKLLPMVYDELRRLAASYFRRERINHTLQPTALVHEAYLRLVGQENVNWQNRAHFFGIAANLMRQILINYAESHNAEKRGGGETYLALDEAISFFQKKDVNIIALNEALEILAQISPRQSRIVEFRFFGGLTIDETAEILKVSPMTVKRDWEMAKTWLYRELKK